MPAPIAIDERFATACQQVISTNYDTCGTVTRSTIEYLTVNQIDALFRPGGLFADLDSWFRHSIEMKTCGVPRNSFYDWIMANADRAKWREAVDPGVRGVGTHSLMQPFIFGIQESEVNRQYFKVTTGWANSAYTAVTTGPLSVAEKALGVDADRIVRVESRYGIPMEEGYFRDRDVFHLFNSESGLNKHGAWRVVASASADDLTYVDVLVKSENAGSTEPFVADPTTGVILLGINNVNDFEKWCHNRANVDNRKRVPFWFQTRRYARCVSESYREVYAELMRTNKAWEQFGDLPLAKRNKQDEIAEQDKFVNAFLFQKPISTNQTLTLWTSLDNILTATGENVDPGGLGGEVMAKRANFIGVREQLRVCSRVFDLANQPLNLLEFFRLLNGMYRARKDAGKGNGAIMDIDFHTSDFYRGQFMTGMLEYYKDVYGDTMHLNMMIAGKEHEQLGIVWDSYRIKSPGNVRINIISHAFFEDYKDQFIDQGINSAGNLLLGLDIGKPGGASGGSIYYAHLKSNRKTYTTARLEELAKVDPTFRCVMEYRSLEQTLQSETGMPIVECPLHSAWLENFNDAPPVHTGEVAPYDNLI